MSTLKVKILKNTGFSGLDNLDRSHSFMADCADGFYLVSVDEIVAHGGVLNALDTGTSNVYVFSSDEVEVV